MLKTTFDLKKIQDRLDYLCATVEVIKDAVLDEGTDEDYTDEEGDMEEEDPIVEDASASRASKRRGPLRTQLLSSSTTQKESTLPPKMSPPTTTSSSEVTQSTTPTSQGVATNPQGMTSGQPSTSTIVSMPAKSQSASTQEMEQKQTPSWRTSSQTLPAHIQGQPLSLKRTRMLGTASFKLNSKPPNPAGQLETS